VKQIHSELYIGIAGGSCSGKTTLERNLQEYYGDTLNTVAFDDFFVGSKALEGVNVTDWESPALYRWSDYKQALGKLRSGQAVKIASHSDESVAEGIDYRLIEPKSIIIAIGFLVLHNPEVNRLFDTSIYLDVPEKEIIRRRLARAAQHPPNNWDSIEYINSGLLPGHRRFVQPQHEIAEHVVSGMLAPEEMTDEVIGIIEGKRKS
jgi:uridine kinase